MADDWHLEVSGTEYRAPLISFFVLHSTAGVPLSWGKTAGADKVTWPPPLHVPPGNLGKASGMVCQVGRRSRQLTCSQHNELRGRTRLLVRRSGHRTQEALSVAASLLSRTPPQGSCEKSARLLPAVPLTASLTVEALRLCDGVASLGNSTPGRRTSQRTQNRYRRLGTRTRRRRTPLSLEFQVVRISTSHIGHRGTGGADGLKTVLRRRHTRCTCENPDDPVVH